ncbi:MAG TPA: GAF domain-containing protein [Puia sp.]|nr:GAF domain-containing protein [Puia sp.]
MNSNPNYDSEFCGKVPIHLINTIQPYGVLLVLSRPGLEIIQVSENAAAIFGRAAPDLVRTPVGRYLDVPTNDALFAVSSGKSADKIPQVWQVGGQRYFALIHIKDDQILVELEARPYKTDEQQSFISVYQQIRYSMSLIEKAASSTEVCAIAAGELRRISGFDKVMIYRFDEDWNGTVIAEERKQDMESYLGFTFPASDIPKQARELYLRNPYRYIPDRTYAPVKLYPVINPGTHSFVDLSDCNVRGVVSVHLEYLANMGVTASMSTRILNNDRLWGLIACHHSTPKWMSFELCSVFELLSNIISARLHSLQNKERADAFTRTQHTYSRIIEQVYETRSLREALLEANHSVLELFGAQGAALISGNEWIPHGQTPGRENVQELMLWLHSRNLKRNLHTDHLSAEFEQAEAMSGTASGLLAIPFNPDQEQYVLLFRPEFKQIIEWGGDPESRIVFEKDGANYHPRNSFKIWRQTVTGSSLPWREEELTAAETLRSFLYEYAAK